MNKIHIHFKSEKSTVNVLGFYPITRNFHFPSKKRLSNITGVTLFLFTINDKNNLSLSMMIFVMAYLLVSDFDVKREFVI